MFSGGGYEEGARWLRNFAASHAKREDPRVEAAIDAEGPREGESYGVRLRLGERSLPPVTVDPLEIAFPDVRDNRGSLAWGQALAGRVRALARELADAERGERRSA